MKNIAYLMDQRGEWRLAPAFDVDYSWNPSGAWTARHQMSVNGKRDGVVLDDLIALGRFGGLKRTRARAIVEEVDACAGRWRDFAEQAGLATVTARKIEAAHRRLVSLAA